MKHYKILLTSISIVIYSCSPKYYVPNTQNVPLLKAKGQTNLTLCGNTNQIEFQGAYGLSNHLGLMANGGFYVPKNLDNGNGGSGKLGEAGFGYFTPVNEHFIFETYGLFAAGSFENHLPSTVSSYPGTMGNISASISRISIQPNFAYTSKYFSIAVSARFASLNYSNIKGDLIFDNKNQIDYLRNDKSAILFEPALTIRGGIEKVKLQLQLLASNNLTDATFKQDKSLVSLGLNFNFGK